LIDEFIIWKKVVDNHDEKSPGYLPGDFNSFSTEKTAYAKFTA